jgi:hypothetical protein
MYVGYKPQHYQQTLPVVVSVLVLLIAFQACQTGNVFLPEAGPPKGGVIFSFNNLASASGLGGLSGVPDWLGTFILPVPFLMIVGTLISP